MKHTIVAVRDNKAEHFFTPQAFVNIAVAQRGFADACTTGEHQYSQHPNDYILFELGHYDDSNGTFDLHMAPIVVLTGTEAITLNPQMKQTDIED